MPSTSLRTWLPRVRRVLLGRDSTGWLPLWAGYFAMSGFYGQAHGFLYDVVVLALTLLLVVALGRLDGYAARKAPSLTRRPSRWFYALAAMCLFCLAAYAGFLGESVNPPDSGWSNLVGGGLWLFLLAGLAGGVTFLGRAVCTGNTRRGFWRHPPAWLGPAASPQPVPPRTPDPYPGDLDEFDVILWSCGNRPIQVIKEIRKLTPLGLKEAKDLADSAPSVVLSRVGKEAADAAMAALTNAGAIAIIR